MLSHDKYCVMLRCIVYCILLKWLIAMSLLYWYIVDVIVNGQHYEYRVLIHFWGGVVNSVMEFILVHCTKSNVTPTHDYNCNLLLHNSRQRIIRERNTDAAHQEDKRGTLDMASSAWIHAKVTTMKSKKKK